MIPILDAKLIRINMDPVPVPVPVPDPKHWFLNHYRVSTAIISGKSMSSMTTTIKMKILIVGQ